MQVAESTQVTQVSPLGPRCSICSHPDCDIIDGLLAAGTVSRRTIASRYGLTDGSVQRHKTNHLGKRIVRAAAKQQDKADSLFRQRLQYLWDETTDGVKRAKAAARTVTDPETGELCYVGRDLGPLAPLLGQAHRNLELLGTATGELNAAAQSVTNIGHISVIMPRAIEPGANQANQEVIDLPAIEAPTDHNT